MAYVKDYNSGLGQVLTTTTTVPSRATVLATTFTTTPKPTAEVPWYEQLLNTGFGIYQSYETLRRAKKQSQAIAEAERQAAITQARQAAAIAERQRIISAQPPPPPTAGGFEDWILPIGLGVGAIVLISMFRR